MVYQMKALGSKVEEAGQPNRKYLTCLLLEDACDFWMEHVPVRRVAEECEVPFTWQSTKLLGITCPVNGEIAFVVCTWVSCHGKQVVTDEVHPVELGKRNWKGFLAPQAHLGVFFSEFCHRAVVFCVLVPTNHVLEVGRELYCVF